MDASVFTSQHPLQCLRLDHARMWLQVYRHAPNAVLCASYFPMCSPPGACGSSTPFIFVLLYRCCTGGTAFRANCGPSFVSGCQCPLGLMVDKTHKLRARTKVNLCVKSVRRKGVEMLDTVGPTPKARQADILLPVRRPTVGLLRRLLKKEPAVICPVPGGGGPLLRLGRAVK
jgi:hypothetical protein